MRARHSWRTSRRDSEAREAGREPDWTKLAYLATKAGSRHGARSDAKQVLQDALEEHFPKTFLRAKKLARWNGTIVVFCPNLARAIQHAKRPKRPGWWPAEKAWTGDSPEEIAKSLAWQERNLWPFSVKAYEKALREIRVNFPCVFVFEPHYIADQVRLDRNGYDVNGRYWGSSRGKDKLWRVVSTQDDAWDDHVRAVNGHEALVKTVGVSRLR